MSIDAPPRDWESFDVKLRSRCGCAAMFTAVTFAAAFGFVWYRMYQIDHRLPDILKVATAIIFILAVFAFWRAVAAAQLATAPIDKRN